MITPIGADRALEQFMDRFDKEVRPRLKSRGTSRFLARNYLRFSADCSDQIAAGLLDSSKPAACPDEFGAEDAEAEQNYEPSWPRRYDHHDSDQQDGETNNRYDDSPSLPKSLHPHLEQKISGSHSVANPILS